MFLKSGDTAFAGMMTALAVLGIVLSGILENCSLFLLAAASFLGGVVFRRVSGKAALGFAAASAVLGLILAPDKLYCLTFLVFTVYVFVAEWSRKVDKRAAWVTKAVAYHSLLAVSLMIMQLFTGIDFLLQTEWIQKLKGVPVLLAVILLLAAELIWLIFDKAYFFFQNHYGHYFYRTE